METTKIYKHFYAEHTVVCKAMPGPGPNIQWWRRPNRAFKEYQNGQVSEGTGVCPYRGGREQEAAADGRSASAGADNRAMPHSMRLGLAAVVTRR